MNEKNICARITDLRKKQAAKPNDRSFAAFLFGMEDALVAVREGKPFVGVFNKFNEDLLLYGALLERQKTAPPQNQEMIKKNMKILEHQLTDEDAAYFAGSYQVCQEVGDKEGCRDIVNTFQWYIKLLIMWYANLKFSNVNDKKSYFTECWLQIPYILKNYRPGYGKTLLSYAYNYLQKALHEMLKENAPEEWNVFDKDEKYIKTISENEKAKTGNELKQQGYILKSKKVEISYDEAATSRGMKELLGIFTPDDD